MNILERYEDYCDKHTEEFKSLLLKVKDSLLAATDTEDFPEESVQKFFETNILRGSVCFAVSEDETAVNVVFCDEIFSETCLAEEYIGDFHFNNNAVKELREFLERYYPGILDREQYLIDLKKRTIMFCFGFNNEFEETEFEFDVLLDKYDAEKQKGRIFEDNLLLFNEDIAKVIGMKIDDEDWDLDGFVYYKTGKGFVATEELESGYLSVELHF